jgi:hypothetical protein
MLITRPRILMTSHLFWYVTDNVRVCINFVHDALETEMYIL